MAIQILPIPRIPKGLQEAAQLGNLIPFIGAGVSRLAGCPDWAQFADSALKWLVDKGKFTYSQFDQIKGLSPRIKLSLARILERENDIHIDFDKLLHPNERDQKGVRLYSSLFKLGQI